MTGGFYAAEYERIIAYLTRIVAQAASALVPSSDTRHMGNSRLMHDFVYCHRQYFRAGEKRQRDDPTKGGGDYPASP